MYKGKCTWNTVSFWLLVIGGLNLGISGIGDLLGSNWNIINLVLGGIPFVEPIVYVLIGISAIVAMMTCKCKTCKVEASM
jgi:uncharacterized membrane protein YuzA (DUF378 family)